MIAVRIRTERQRYSCAPWAPVIFTFITPPQAISQSKRGVPVLLLAKRTEREQAGFPIRGLSQSLTLEKGRCRSEQAPKIRIYPLRFRAELSADPEQFSQRPLPAGRR